MAAIDAEELLALAREQIKSGQHQLAETLLNQAVLTYRDNPQLFYLLATIYYDKGKFSRAIQAFKKALELDPHLIDAGVGLSVLYNDLGRYEEGKKAYELAAQAIEQLKTGGGQVQVEERFASKHEELGDLYFHHKRFDEAMEQYDRAYRLSNRKPDMMMKVVECLLNRDANRKAVKELKVLVKEYPQFLPARLKLGLIYFNSDRIFDAIEQWESVLLRDPQNAEAKRYLKMAQASGLAPVV